MVLSSIANPESVTHLRKAIPDDYGILEIQEITSGFL